ncbi:MAG: adenine phosphoribosyltransferase [Rhodobacteraceae bacterium]|nr:adenine phosphoribosyltransferase [Paracoccaceae bacterium]
MKRTAFRKLFGATGTVVTPVVHAVSSNQVVHNIEIAMGEGAHGVFLINHDFGVEEFLPIVKATRDRFADIWLALNFLAVTGKSAFPIIEDLQSGGCPIDAYWADDARIDERLGLHEQVEAREIADIYKSCRWNGLYFGGTAFKKQREVAPEDYGASAALAPDFMDVVTTSGVATGHEADTSKIQTFRNSIGESALALASGITPENAPNYTDVDCFMVATGINREGDFYNIDPARLSKLMKIADKQTIRGADENDH